MSGSGYEDFLDTRYGPKVPAAAISVTLHVQDPDGSGREIVRNLQLPAPLRLREIEMQAAALTASCVQSALKQRPETAH
jgi:hypothetical protein